MTSPLPYRVVAGLRIPLPLVPRIIEALRARYPDATEGAVDADAAVRLALRAWVVETLAEHEQKAAVAPLDMTIVQTVTDFEARGQAAKQKAVDDSQAIVDDV